MKKIIILGFALLFVTGCGCSKSIETREKELEAKMKEYASDFYEKNVKDYMNGIDAQKVTIADLKKQGYDTDLLVDPTSGTACTAESYATIKIKNPDDVANSKYTVENHLVCGKYKTKN